jgi:hypothetical protein
LPNSVEQFLRFTDRRGQVGIGEQADIAAGMQHPVAYTKTFAAIPWVLDEMNLGVSATVVPNDLGGVVARAVIHDQDLGIPLVFVDVTKDLIEGGPKPIAFVVSRDDDAVGQSAVLSSQFSVLSKARDSKFFSKRRR